MMHNLIGLARVLLGTTTFSCDADHVDSWPDPLLAISGYLKSQSRQT